MLLDCPTCAATNRIPQGKRTRCGKCARMFTPADLARSRPEPPPAPPQDIDEEEWPAWTPEDEREEG